MINWTTRTRDLLTLVERTQTTITMKIRCMVKRAAATTSARRSKDRQVFIRCCFSVVLFSTFVMNSCAVEQNRCMY